MKKTGIVGIAFLGACTLFMSAIVAYGLDHLLSRRPLEELSLDGLLSMPGNPAAVKLFLVIELAALALLLWAAFQGRRSEYRMETARVTDRLRTPVAMGQAQHGSARWLPRDAYAKAFAAARIDVPALERMLAETSAGDGSDEP